MTFAQVVETSVTVTDNSPSQDYPHPDDRTTLSTVCGLFGQGTRQQVRIFLVQELNSL